MEVKTRVNRKSYNAQFKLEVVGYAEEKGNRSAARMFNVGETSVREWLRDKNILQGMHKRRRTLRYGKCFWPDLENDLVHWIHEQRENGTQISTTRIILKAKELAKMSKIENFHAFPSWCFRFMKRNNLSIRASTSIGQQLPFDWENKIINFRQYLQDNMDGVEANHFGNMDEVPVTFDLPASRTVNRKGAKHISIVTTGHEKCNFTVMLTVTSDGSKLLPMVIFKRKTIPKLGIRNDIIVQANLKGWVNQDMLKIWFDEIWRKRKQALFCQKSIIMMDSCRSHITDQVKKLLNKHSKLAIIPGGLTKELQPLDLTINKSFKSKLRSIWEDWMISGVHDYTKSGKIKRASYYDICNWIVSAWEHVPRTCIISGFRKSLGTETHPMTENDAVYEENVENYSDVPEEILNVIDSLNFESDDDFSGFV